MEALGTTIEKLELIGRSRALGRIWVAPESEKENSFELTEVLDAHNLFRALSGKIVAYEISLAGHVSDPTKHDAADRSDFERLTKIQGFLLSLMLLAPVDPIYSMSWDPTDWEKKLKQIESMGYRLFAGPAGIGRRALAFLQSDDLAIQKKDDRTRVYSMDLADPFEAQELTPYQDS